MIHHQVITEKMENEAEEMEVTACANCHNIAFILLPNGLIMCGKCKVVINGFWIRETGLTDKEIDCNVPYTIQ